MAGTAYRADGTPAGEPELEWQVVSSALQGIQPQAVAGRSGSCTTLENDFTVIPADRTWRPVPQQKPSVDGLQSAVVTGPEGEEIFCDEHGRVVGVKFNWYRYNPPGPGQLVLDPGGAGVGGAGVRQLSHPARGPGSDRRFSERRSDQPITMGRTYHAENTPPGGLPGTKTQMTIRSKTYMGSGYNELMFEDKAGQELLSMHAQKDMKTTVLNDQGRRLYAPGVW